MSYESKVRIEVTNDVHSALRELKERGESFNDVLRRIVLPSKGIAPDGE